jgi:large subunit ribosomal protein L13
MKTFHLKNMDIKRKWILIDVSKLSEEKKRLGRLSSFIAQRLKGKHNPSFTPHLVCGDNIVVINTENLSFTGDKLNQKSYYRHSGYFGGLKETKLKIMMQNKVEEVLQFAVKGMLRRNPLRRELLRNLYIYSGNEHKHSAQQPELMENI